MSSEIITTSTNEFRVGVLGCGQHGSETRMPAVTALADEGVVLAAVADRDSALARRAGEKFEVPAYGSVEEMIDHANLDGLIVVVPPAAHRDVVLYALSRNLDVLCEKPGGLGAADMLAMTTAAEQSGRVLAPGSQYPFQIEGSIDFVARGGIGVPYQLDANWVRSVSASPRGIPAQPHFWNDPHGRGVGADLGSHLLAAGLPMLGREPVGVSAVSSNLFGGQKYGEEFRVEDTLSTTVYWDGAHGRFTASWAAHVAEDQLWMRVLGDRGSILVPMMAGESDPEPFRPIVTSANGERWHGAPPLPTEQAFVAQQLNWVNACRGSETLRVGPRDAVQVQRVLDLAYQSAGRTRTGGEQIGF